MTDFLYDRFQRVKFVDGCVSEWGLVPSRVPQGIKFRVTTIDNTTVTEIVPKEQTSNVQEIANRLEDWSRANKFQLN